MNCPNCNTDFDTRFCPNCGTEHHVERLTTYSLIKDSLSTIFSVDKSFFRQMWLMLVNPGKIINDYRNGFRRYYISPLRMLFITTVFLSASFLITEGNFLGISVVLSEDTKFISQGFIFFALFLPMIIISTWLTYLWKEWNFAESTVLAIYNFSFWILIFSIITVPYYYFMEELGIVIQPFLILLILLWNTRAFEMKIHSKVLMLILNYLIFIVIATIIFALIYLLGSLIIQG